MCKEFRGIEDLEDISMKNLRSKVDGDSPLPLLAVSSRILSSPMMAPIVKRLYPCSGEASNMNEVNKAQSM